MTATILQEKLQQSKIVNLLSEVCVNRCQEVTVTILPESLMPVVAYLRDDQDFLFHQLIDICGVDYPQRSDRFEIVYHFLSMFHNQRLRLKLSLPDTQSVPSLCDLYPTANWLEREVFDMYGVGFANHPDLRRILTDYGFEGHPLRKDFPLSGFVELRYSEMEKRVVKQPVRLVQEYRDFDFSSPWEKMQHAATDAALAKSNQMQPVDHEE